MSASVAKPITSAVSASDSAWTGRKLSSSWCSRYACASRASARASCTACSVRLFPGNIKVGRDGLFDILRQERLLVQPQRAYHKTTNSHHRFRRHPNLLREYKTPDAVHWAFLQQ